MRHPDEGVIQGWVEAQLPAGEAAEVASHLAGCAECQALVAEIRGLMARSAGIVAALDGAAGAGVPPLGIAVGESTRVAPAAGEFAATSAPGPRRQRVTWRRWAPALAAAVVVVAVMRQASTDDVGRERVRDALRGDGAASAPAVPTPVPVIPPRVATDGGSGSVPTPVPAPNAAPSAPPAPSPRRRAAANDASAPADAASIPGAEVRAAVPAAAPAPAPVPAPAPPPPSVAAERVPAASGAAAQVRAERIAAKSSRMAPAMEAAIGAMNQSATTCYRAISAFTIEFRLGPDATARVVGRGAAQGRWVQEGDSITVRWRDSVAVFPAGMDRPRGRIGVVEGPSLPLALVRGCP